MTSNSPDDLPQDPPSGYPSFHSIPESSGTSLTDTESYSRNSRTRESTRSSKDSGIYGEITRTFRKLQTRLLEEKRRADEAERRLADVTAHLKAVNDARLKAMQDAAQAKEDLRLYKIQLEHAQREIYRAQDAISLVDRQRLVAEEEAARNRSKARQLNETLLVHSAREEAWRMGLHEGLNKGRNIALAEFSDPPYGPTDHTLLDEESSQENRSQEDEIEDDGRFHIKLQSAASSVRSKAPPEPSRQASQSVLTTAPPASRATSRGPSVHTSEQIRPVSVRNVVPSPRLHSPALPIPDNLIPSLDADNRIRLPPAFEFSRTPERPASPQLPPVSDISVEAIPIPPPAQSSQHRKHGHRRNSSSSSSLSALDLFNDPFTGPLRTPMSAIPEVASQYTSSPHTQSNDADHLMRHQSSFGGSFRQPSLSHNPSVGRLTPEIVSQQRPTSQANFAGSSKRSSVVSSPPEIDIQPPSLTTSHKTESLRGMGSPAFRSHGIPRTAETSRPSSLLNGMPGGPMNTYSTIAPFTLERQHSPAPSETAKSSRHDYRRGKSRMGVEFGDEDDAVSSALSADTLTTPPRRYQVLGDEGAQVGDAEGSTVGHGGPRSAISRHGSVNTAVYSVPDSAATEDMTGIGTATKVRKKGKKRK